MKKPGQTPIPKMYRGQDRWVWEAALLNAGWPQPLAALMSAFLTGEGPLPQWPLTQWPAEPPLARRIVEP